MMEPIFFDENVVGSILYSTATRISTNYKTAWCQSSQRWNATKNISVYWLIFKIIQIFRVNILFGSRKPNNELCQRKIRISLHFNDVNLDVIKIATTWWRKCWGSLTYRRHYNILVFVIIIFLPARSHFSCLLCL